MIFLKNYPLVEEKYNTPYGMPELDPLRHEISLCLMFGFHQAAITLTNHLIEWYVKLMLIYKDSIEKSKSKDASKSNYDNLESYFEEGINSYMGKDMSITINKAKSMGIFTKEQWKKLDEIREDFRNAFSHADSSKIFKDIEIEVTGLSTTNGTFKSESPLLRRISKNPIMQGQMKVNFAELHAIEYFTFIDDLIRETLPKVIPSINKK
ncbi:MAG: hypothetical protein C4539_07370 [Ignavibacteriales bacterium]|nr:MAG: hypothetical protein C4539_07370 [Ignavibacteriales bacterium]